MPIDTCPITKEILRVPVLTNEETVCDFVSLARQMLSGNANDPITGNPILTLSYAHITKELSDTQAAIITPLSNKEITYVAELYLLITEKHPNLIIYDIQTLEGVDVLIQASKQESTSNILIDAAVQSIDWMIGDNRASLCLALVQRNTSTFRRFLAAGGNPNCVLNKETTALSYASSFGALAILNVLLAAGADPNLANSTGSTPFCLAVDKGWTEIVTVLLEAGASPNLADTSTTPLCYAAYKGWTEIVTALLEAKSDPNLAGFNGNTPLVVAAAEGQVEIVTLLLNAGADPSQAMANGITPLFIAAGHERGDVVVALLNAGADPDQTDVNGKGSLYDEAVCVHRLLSTETSRDYYLKKIIKNPDLMRDTFIKHPVLCETLTTYRSELWERLRDPAHLDLEPDEYHALLTSILDSQAASDESQHHPLYTLFKEPVKKVGKVPASGVRPSGSTSIFEDPITPITLTKDTILDDIQALVDAHDSQKNLQM